MVDEGTTKLMVSLFDEATTSIDAPIRVDAGQIVAAWPLAHADGKPFPSTAAEW